ncbi:polysaccharide deacetylase family protein [Olivibacter sitiensis]|uniref:polysaccharide deacetylase family protein n=1 Tax=Olivibacter sitiensis TaxID=376470 RepID=UPI001FDF336D|nr:polysaccharide deacetylase family protein [Olivibacter sitiensis]
MFTADEFGGGARIIENVLDDKDVKASFFLTGRFLDNKDNEEFVQSLVNAKHYVGVHSDQHLLYCDWEDRNKLLVDKKQFYNDLQAAYLKLGKFGIDKSKALLFLPPYEWYNKKIVDWTKEQGLKLVNFSVGTLSTADYTYPEMGNRYRDNETIWRSIMKYEENSNGGLNGFFLLIHLGADPRRQKGFYEELPRLIKKLTEKGYVFRRMDELIN